MTARAAKPGKETIPVDEAELDRLFPPIDEEDPAYKAWLKAAVEESLADPRPSIPGEEVFARIRQRHEARLKRGL
jgi:Stability determinant